MSSFLQKGKHCHNRVFVGDSRHTEFKKFKDLVQFLETTTSQMTQVTGNHGLKMLERRFLYVSRLLYLIMTGRFLCVVRVTEL